MHIVACDDRYNRNDALIEESQEHVPANMTTDLIDVGLNIQAFIQTRIDRLRIYPRLVQTNVLHTDASTINRQARVDRSHNRSFCINAKRRSVGSRSSDCAELIQWVPGFVVF